jgi:hypothetical protein
MLRSEQIPSRKNKKLIRYSEIFVDNIKDIVRRVIGEMAEQKVDISHKLQECWPKMLESAEAAHAQVAGYREGIVYVHVDSPAWLYQLNTKKKKILQKLKLVSSEIKDVRFKLGEQG